MPVETTTQTNITCDNPDCPGNDLDPAVRTGWLFISSEFYGSPVNNHVFCCADCAGIAAQNAEVDFPGEPITPTPAPMPPVTVEAGA